MGHPVEEDTYTSLCTRCFPVGFTPQKLVLSLAGIQKSTHFPLVTESPPNGSLILNYTGLTCEWYGSNSSIYRAFGSFRQYDSQVTVEVNNEEWAFVKTVDELCVRWFPNHFQDPNTYAFYGGFAVLMSNNEIVNAVNAVIPVEISDARFEIFPGPDGIIDIRYASKKQRTNMIIQFDSSEL